MSVEQFITEHLDPWTGAVTTKSTSGRSRQDEIELTGIKKLRELITDLAVRGKLLQQAPTDESASNLTIKIAAERERLVKRGEIKRLKRLPQVDATDQPYCLPPNWTWIRLGEATNYGIAEKAEPNDVSGETWVLELQDIEKESSRLVKKIRQYQRPFKSSKNHFQKGDVLYGKLRPYLDKVVVADECGICTTEIVPLRGFYGLAPNYLRLALKSPVFKNYANSSTHGMNLPRLGTDKARLALLPLPPENEQHRIVQKVDELIALCDRLEQQTRDQHAAHETLVDALLDTLTQSKDADELADNWARLAAHFDTLFTTERSIERLKQIILTLSVTGRLVQQDCNDESASILLEKISHKKAMHQARSLEKYPEPPELFEIPRGWVWAALRNVGLTATGKTPPTKEKKFFGGRIPFIGPGQIAGDGLIVAPDKYLSEDGIKESEEAAPDDLLVVCIGGSIGKTAKVKQRCGFNQQINKLRPIISNADYLLAVLNADFFQASIRQRATGSATPIINRSKWENIWIPLPPLNEQTRIVSKLHELFTLSDELKAQLNQAGETRRQMASAVVEQAIH